VSPISIAIPVDDRLLWVLRVPEQPLGSARPSSAETLSELASQLEEPRPAELMERMIDAAARVVAAALADLPELPYIGEPFGGEDGTD
jgi:phytoene/squalene synthetase